MFISGDLHWAEFLEDECTSHIHGYPLREFVSSSLTHSQGVIPLFGGIIDAWIDIWVPRDFYMPLNAKRTVIPRFLENNFGLIDFFIDESNPKNDFIKWVINDNQGYEVYSKILGAEDFK